MRDQINDYIKTCEICQKVKSSSATKAPLVPIKTSFPNELVTSDLAGPFVIRNDNNVYLQVIVDHFTKVIVLAAMPNKKTKSSIKNITKKWCCVYGIPDTILTDGGKEYQFMKWDAICEVLDINRVKTTPWHPECDGLIKQQDSHLFKLCS